ncbi:Protein of unknown function DUF1064 [uncultured Caudovirales phage]|uniref:DUF1064 domain-containing protein n=1 Tax=uncultured Caudovirales phage TaxID=2100421 RepID=A0A6J5NKZ0_9CAUD|nr:Protein of unknown function DUF1064 [uncultured Caudovirales phage]
MTLRPLKFRNIKTVADGIVFDSQKEARRYGELKLLQRAGEITCLELQPKFPIVINGVKVCTYVADFGYVDHTGSALLEDCKGFKTREYIIKRKLMKAVYGIDILET